MRESWSFEVEFLDRCIFCLWKLLLSVVDFLWQVVGIWSILHISNLLYQEVSQIFNLGIRLCHCVLKAGKLSLWLWVIIALSRTCSSCILLSPLILNILNLIIHFFFSEKLSQTFKFILNPWVSVSTLAVEQRLGSFHLLLASADSVKGSKITVTGGKSRSVVVGLAHIWHLVHVRELLNVGVVYWSVFFVLLVAVQVLYRVRFVKSSLIVSVSSGS